MNNSYITIIKEKRTALSRKRVPLNQNECTDDFRIDVPFEQNLHTGCSDNKNNQSLENNQEEENVLAESPLLGEWTLNKTSTAAGSATMAEMIYGKLYSEPDVFNFKDDGAIESQTNEFN